MQHDNFSKLNRSEKIILFLHEQNKKNKKKLSYEDISVGLFKKYPNEFHLKGYPEYPDSSDSAQRILYEFKKKGYVSASNKIFSITESGSFFASTLEEKLSGNSSLETERLSRMLVTEISRIKNLEGFLLFLSNEVSKITENDMYAYIGISSKTSKSVFLGRMETLKRIMEELTIISKNDNNPLYTSIVNYHTFLTGKYVSLIDFYSTK